MDFVPRPESEQPPDLRFGEFAGTIAFQRQALKGRSRDAGSTAFQVARAILGRLSVICIASSQFLDLFAATVCVDSSRLFTSPGCGLLSIARQPSAALQASPNLAH
jgi:hypothetical protein